MGLMPNADCVFKLNLLSSERCAKGAVGTMVELLRAPLPVMTVTGTGIKGVSAIVGARGTVMAVTAALPFPPHLFFPPLTPCLVNGGAVDSGAFPFHCGVTARTTLSTYIAPISSNMLRTPLLTFLLVHFSTHSYLLIHTWSYLCHTSALPISYCYFHLKICILVTTDRYLILINHLFLNSYPLHTPPISDVV